MNIFRSCVLIIDCNNVYSAHAPYFHIDATQELINKNFDGLNIKENAGNDYMNFICNRYSLVLIHCLNNSFLVSLPDKINEYQVKKLSELKDYINYLNEEKNNIITLFKYKKSYYKNINEVINLLRGEILERKRSK